MLTQPVYQEIQVEGPKESLEYLEEIAQNRFGIPPIQLIPLENGNYRMEFVARTYKPKDLSDFYSLARKRDSNLKVIKKSLEKGFDNTDFDG
jgi:hypothetical protein